MIEKKRIIALVAAATIVSSFAVGCNGKTPTSSSKKENITITFATNRTDIADTLLNDLGKEYSKTHTNVKVEFEALKDPDSVLKTRASAGELPDISCVPTTSSPKDWPLYYAPLESLGYTAANLNGYKDGLGTDGKLYGLNSGSGYNGVIYNKKAFKDAGIDKVPRTMQEFYDDCAKLKAKGIIPLASNFKDKWPLGVYSSDCTLAISNTNNPNYKNELINHDLFTEDNGLIAGFKFLRDMKEKGYLEPDLMSTNWDQMKKDQATGKIAMAYLGSWYPPQVVQNGAAKEDVGMFPFPDTKAIPLGGDWKFAVAKNSKHLEETKTFLKWIWEDGKYAKACSLPSPIKGSKIEDPAVAELLSFNLPTVETATASPEQLQRFTDSQIDLQVVLQEYIISKDPQSVVKKYNDKWNSAKK